MPKSPKPVKKVFSQLRFTCGAFGFIIPRFLSAGRIECDGKIQPPRVNSTRGAPSYVNDPVYYNYGILSSMGAVK